MATRLPPAANDFPLTLVVNKKLVPYFTKWYQATKQVDDTPEAFALRLLKAQAVNYYQRELVDAESADAAQIMNEVD